MSKRIIILSILFLNFIYVAAQELKLNIVELLPNDDYAVVHPRLDGNKDTCAVLKIYFNQDAFGQLQFESPLMLGSADYSAGFYAVYLANGTKNLTLRHNACSPVTINFGNYNVSIERGKTYKVEVNALGLKNTQTVVFSMLPLSGYIDINDRKEKVTNGALQIELAPGIYEYKAYDGNNYYVSKEGVFDVSETGIGETKVISLKLEPRKARVQFTCNVEDAMLYVDNEEYGMPGEKLLPLGEHEVHVIGKRSADYIQKKVINSESDLAWNIKLKPNAYIPVVIEGDGICNSIYIDNRIVKDWYSGKVLMLKRGKHLITWGDGNDMTIDESRKVKIDQNTERIAPRSGTRWRYGTCEFHGNQPSSFITIGQVMVWYNGELKNTRTVDNVPYYEGTGDMCVLYPKDYNGPKFVFSSSGGSVQIKYQR